MRMYAVVEKNMKKTMFTDIAKANRYLLEVLNRNEAAVIEIVNEA